MLNLSKPQTGLIPDECGQWLPEQFVIPNECGKCSRLKRQFMILNEKQLVVSDNLGV